MLYALLGPLRAVDVPVDAGLWHADYAGAWWERIGPQGDQTVLVPGPSPATPPTARIAGCLILDEWTRYAFDQSVINVRNGIRLLGPPDRVRALPHGGREFIWDRPVLVDGQLEVTEDGEWALRCRFYGQVIRVLGPGRIERETIALPAALPEGVLVPSPQQ